MLSYPFILDLSKNILSKSRSIQGRVYYAPYMGAELNSDELGQVIEDIVKRETKFKYPLVLIMPPTSAGGYQDNGGEWESFSLTFVFLKTSFAENNLTQFKNPNTNTSTHSIYEDWHDMKRAAENYINVLGQVIKLNRLQASALRFSGEKVITPISIVGKDRASGVLLRFSLELWNGCSLEDYDENDIKNIKIPAKDSHPEHKM